MFGQRLHALREEYGYSMDRLVELYNKRFHGKMNKSTLSRYENGKQDPLYHTVINLALLFNVSVDYLACRTDVRDGRAQGAASDEQLKQALFGDASAATDDMLQKVKQFAKFLLCSK